MERFVFIAAVTIAVIFGIGAMFSGGRFHFDIDHDGEIGGSSAIVETAPGRMDAQVFAGEHLRIRSIAANVTVIPEERSDFQIEIDNSAGRTPMPDVSSDENRVTIDGQLRGRVESCDNGGADLRGYDDVAAEDLPRITVRAPRSLSVSFDGAGAMEIGPSESLSVELTDCGTAAIGDVAGDLDVDVAGSGEVRAGAARSLNVDLAGSGEVGVGAVAEGASVDIAGSGEVQIASLAGELKADGAGSGNLRISGGAITTAEIDLAGSGDVEIAASVRTLNVSIVGSGNVDVDGEVGDIDADIAGSGSVDARVVTGSISRAPERFASESAARLRQRPQRLPLRRKLRLDGAWSGLYLPPLRAGCKLSLRRGSHERDGLNPEPG